MHLLSYMHHYLPSMFEPFQQRQDPANHCPMQTRKFRLDCTFNKNCLLKHDPWHVFGSGPKLQQVHAQPRLVLSLGVKLNFNDHVFGKTSGLFVRKKSKCHCEGWGISEFLVHINRFFLKYKEQIWDKIRYTFKKKKRWFMAGEELSSQVIIINEHQCIMHTHSTVMMTMPTAAWQDILGESVKQILNIIPNKHLVDYHKKKTFSWS